MIKKKYLLEDSLSYFLFCINVLFISISMLLPLAASIFFYTLPIALILIKMVVYITFCVIFVLVFLLCSPFTCLYMNFFRNNYLIKIKKELAQIISDDKS